MTQTYNFSRECVNGRTTIRVETPNLLTIYQIGKMEAD